MQKGRLLQHSTFLILSKIANYAAIFFTGVVLTRSLSKAEYGTFSQVVLLSMTISLILGVWLAKSIYFFVPTSGRKKEIVLQTNLVLFVLGLTAGLAVWLFRYQISSWFQNPALASLAVYVSLYVLMLTLFQLSEAFFISVDRAHILALTNFVFSLVYVTVLSYVLLKGVSLCQLLTVIILLYLGLNAFVLTNMITFPGAGCRILNAEFLRRQFHYAAPLFLSSFVIVVGRQIDKFIIAAVYPTTDFAVYFRGALELPVVMIVTYTISNMLLPKFVQLFQAGREKDFLRVWHEAIKKTTILIYPLFTIFFFISHRFLTFLYTDRYAESVPIFRIYLLVLLLQVTAYDCVLQATGRTREIFYASMINVISNLTVSLILIRVVGLRGAAIGLVFGQVISTCYYLIRIRRIFSLSFALIFPWFHVLKVLALAMGLGALAYTINFLEWFPSKPVFMGAYVLIFSILYTVFIFLFKFLRLTDLKFMKISLFSRGR